MSRFFVGATALVVLLLATLNPARGDWSYADAETWAIAYPQCGQPLQSPLNLIDAIAVVNKSLPDITFGADCSLEHIQFFQFANNHDTITITPSFLDGVLCTVADPRSKALFSLSTIVVHHESEHAFDGRREQLELQLNFLRGAQKLTIAVPITTAVPAGVTADATQLDLLAFLLANPSIPNRAGGAVTVDTREFPSGIASTALQVLKPTNRNYFAYFGSMTAPPCQTPVQWMVFNHPVYVRPADFERYVQILNATDPTDFSRFGNARPLQPLDNRTLHYAHLDHDNPPSTPTPIDDDADHKRTSYIIAVVIVVIVGVIFVGLLVFLKMHPAPRKASVMGDQDYGTEPEAEMRGRMVADNL